MAQFDELTIADIDWRRLLELRQAFLSGKAIHTDYWTDERLLRDYDATFGRRIAWKWQWVLADLLKLGWEPPAGLIHDWGCGPGIAAREFADFFTPSAVRFTDRSPLAVRYATRSFQESFPHVPLAGTGSPSVLLLSHVLGELPDDTLSKLLRDAKSAQCILWLEPGTHELSRKLISIREKLLPEGWNVIAPCVHAQPCAMLRPENQRHWCHHFATPPTVAFTDTFWGNFANIMEVDLRSLPVSYLVLDRRPHSPPSPSASDDGTIPVRILGRCRLYKPYAVLQGCDACGIHERQLTKRKFPAWFRKFRHHESISLAQWKIGEREVDAFGQWPHGES